MRPNACEHALAYIYQYLDGEISPTRHDRIKDHLRDCGECSPAFDFESRLKEMIREKCQDEPPPELFDRLRTLIREQGPGTLHG
jgi:mycothiol system anti-sigma-R factor